MSKSLKVGDVYRPAGSRYNYTVIRVTKDLYTYVTSGAVNTVLRGEDHPFPEPYFVKVHSA